MDIVGYNEDGEPVCIHGNTIRMMISSCRECEMVLAKETRDDEHTSKKAERIQVDGLTKHVDMPPLVISRDDTWIIMEEGDRPIRIDQIGPTVDLDVTPPTAQDAEAPALVPSWADQQPVRWWPLPLKWTSERPKVAGYYWYRDRLDKGDIYEVYADADGGLVIRNADESGDFDLDYFCKDAPEGEWSDAPIARPEEP